MPSSPILSSPTSSEKSLTCYGVEHIYLHTNYSIGYTTRSLAGCTTREDQVGGTNHRHSHLSAKQCKREADQSGPRTQLQDTAPSKPTDGEAAFILEVRARIGAGGIDELWG